MAFEITPLAISHASAAAVIHADGQPNTFLTNLGSAFLRALYSEMAASPHCLGYVAIDGQEVVGVVVGTTDSGAVFKEMLWKRGLRLAMPVLAALLRRPKLFPQVLQTLSYPGQAAREPDEAELFFIGTKAERRRKGVGCALFHALTEEFRAQGMKVMGLTVEATNDIAKRFYQRNGMRPSHTLTRYGRQMYWYSLPLEDEENHCG